jgi:hypothetical protein
MQTPESIRYEVVRMLRLLVEITQTLDKIPDERYVLMKIEYTDDAPDDFETPNFTAATAEQLVSHFEHAPFTMCAADCATPGQTFKF